MRGGPRGGGHPRGGAPPRQNMRGRGSWRQNSEPLKFESDFDFDSSNALFDKEEIEKELKQKLTIGGGKWKDGVCNVDKALFVPYRLCLENCGLIPSKRNTCRNKQNITSDILQTTHADTYTYTYTPSLLYQHDHT